MRYRFVIVVLFLFMVTAGKAISQERTSLQQSTLAFLSAEGYGRYATGGRGGKVYNVTTLDDHSLPGSLRYAINQSGPRTIVFRVSGTIALKSSLTIRNKDVTIAGQTAPGDGICIKNFPLAIASDNVIVRYIRVRTGNEVLNKAGDEYDALTGTGRKNIIIDHCSFSWGNDETASFYDNSNFTMQWCIISESFYNSTHSKGNHGYGGIWGGMGATFHHNLLAHHTSRNPRFNGSRYHRQPAKEVVDFVNNVIYNWGSNSSYGGEQGQQNIRANYYKKGPATSSGSVYRIINPTVDPGTNTSFGKFFVADNYVFGYADVTADNISKGVQGLSLSAKDTVIVKTPFPTEEIAAERAEDAYLSVLANAGASFPKRDAIDERIVSEARTGTATYGKTYNGGAKGIIDSQNDVGGYPVLQTLATPPDTDNDGMPDHWEVGNGLNAADAADGNTLTAEGFTMLEVYMNQLVESTPAAGIDELGVSENPDGYKLAQNHPNPFNNVTVISFAVPGPDQVDIAIFNNQGKLVRELFKGEPGRGTHQVSWDGANASGSAVASGQYLCRLTSSGYCRSIKLLLTK